MNSLLQSIFLFLFFNFTFGLDEGYVNRPRGVPPELTALYQDNVNKEKEEFQCFDGTKKIPFNRVNDDYCDCLDGSDEPGTSACSNGRFYCRNFGFESLSIPSSRVNDGICDCCDGSDEYDSGIECSNICEKLGESARAQAKETQKLHETGHAKRIELAKEGEKVLEEKRLALDKKKKELEELLPIKVDLESKKNLAEDEEKKVLEVFNKARDEQRQETLKKESEDLFLKVDIDADKRVTLAELKTFYGIKDEDENFLNQIKEVFADFSELDFEAFSKNYNRIRDLDHQKNIPTSKDPQHDENSNDSESADLERDNYSESKHHYDEETKALVEEAEKVRKEYNEISNKASLLEEEIRNYEKILSSDYGDDRSWAPLKDQCVEYHTNQYIYKLCIFDKSVQKEKNGHSEVILGYWDSWSGPEQNIYSSQKYTRGQSCWNGPERSTFVDITCGKELELVDTSEPAKCELLAPSACLNPADLDKHTEL